MLHTRPEGLAVTRSPLQVGAELYGHAGLDSDVEIIRLMLETLKACHVDALSIRASVLHQPAHPGNRSPINRSSGDEIRPPGNAAHQRTASMACAGPRRIPASSR